MNSDQNLRAAQATYTGFVGLVKWGTIAAVAVAALVILLIAK
ncbi:MAG TPA: aa3-type cytochrome c oxidase subunit IV [Sphingobium sp.]